MKYRIRWENKNFDDMGTLRKLGSCWEKIATEYVKGSPE